MEPNERLDVDSAHGHTTTRSCAAPLTRLGALGQHDVCRVVWPSSFLTIRQPRGVLSAQPSILFNVPLPIAAEVHRLLAAKRQLRDTLHLLAV